MNNEDNNSHDPTLLTFLFCLDWQTLSGKNWFTEQLTHLSLNLTKMSSWSSFLFLTHFMYDLDLMYLPPFPSTQFSYWSVWVFTVIFFLSLHTCSYTLWPLGGSSVQLKQLIYLEPCCPAAPPPHTHTHYREYPNGQLSSRLLLRFCYTLNKSTQH